jgi:DNA-binding MltR family transcriptional regulator
MHLSKEKSKLIAEALVKESDRGCVIIGATLLAEALEELLKSVCRQTAEDIKATIDPLFQGYAPLSTFSAKIQVSFALGILPRSLRDKIEIVRRLRNDFAHEWGPIDFDDPRCASRVNLVIGPPSEKKQPTEREFVGPLGPTRQQLVTRIAFALSIQDIVSVIGRLEDLAREGTDIRRIVRHMEEQGFDVSAL